MSEVKEKTADLATDPPLVVSQGVRRIPRLTRQLGHSQAIRSDGDRFHPFTRPSTAQLAAWESAVRQEPVLQAAVTMIARSLITRIGDFIHPVPEIADWVNANLEGRVKRWMDIAVRTAVQSGFATNEILWTYQRTSKGFRVWIDDLIPFHAQQVQFILNDWGRLTHGERVKYHLQRTGVWVPFPINTHQKGERFGSFVRLPKSKVFHTALNSFHPTGQSMIDPVVKFHFFKNVFIDMYSTALDRYGRPLVAVKVPPQNTQELIQDPGEEEPRFKTLQEQVAEELENIGPESFLVLTQTDKVNQPIEFQSLTTANNYGDTFKNAIEFCDRNMLIGMGVPNLLLIDQGTSLGSTGASERQLELFNVLIDSLFDQIVADFNRQVIAQLITFNFDQARPEYRTAGRIERLPARPADVKTFSSVVKDMAEIGAINLRESRHLEWVQAMLSVPRSSLPSTLSSGASGNAETNP